ncbi:MAG: hypothetical protein KDJ63_12920 [Nitratireductor sp.]|nr:hypothetical protein [Nitratireductor sp.]
MKQSDLSDTHCGPVHDGEFRRVEFLGHASHLTPVERVLLGRTPTAHAKDREQEVAFLPAGLEDLRFAAHMDRHRITSLLKRGTDVQVNPEGFGLALKLAAFELSHEGITTWAGFVLIMQKLVGDQILPWLPALYRAAAALPGAKVPAFAAGDIAAFAAALDNT